MLAVPEPITKHMAMNLVLVFLPLGFGNLVRPLEFDESVSCCHCVVEGGEILNLQIVQSQYSSPYVMEPYHTLFQ